MNRKPIIIGEAPSRIGDAEKPLSGRCGAKLCKLMGMPKYDYDQLASEFDLANLLQTYQRSSLSKKGHAYDLPTAILSARNLRAQGILDDRLVILLGKRVANAVFERSKVPDYFMMCIPYSAGVRRTMVVVPHPSGVSHYWNDPSSTRKATTWWSMLRNSLRASAVGA